MIVTSKSYQNTNVTGLFIRCGFEPLTKVAATIMDYYPIRI